MDEHQPAVESQTMGSRIVNIFSSPAEAFDGIASLESKTKLWILPMMIAMAMAIAFSFVIASNDALKGQIVEMQKQRLDKAVAENKLTQDQADQQVEAMERMGTLFAVFGSVGAIVMVCLMYFGGALFLWLVGKLALKAAHGYSTYLTVYGLASWIGVLGSLTTMMMMVGLGSMYATPSAALAVFSEFDVTNKTHYLLSKLEIFSLWQTVVVGIGLAKLTGTSPGTGMGISFGFLILIWLVGYLFSFGF